MRRLIVNEFLTLDGTAQAGGRPDEDTSGGFKHGGWHMQYGAPDGMEELIGDPVASCSGGARTSSSPAIGPTPPKRSMSSPSR
jgi:hypothetical protein